MLTSTKLNALKPKDKAYTISDGNGLYIEISPIGSKYWRQNYRFNGKQKKLAHGVYPATSLAEARKLKDEALAELKAGNDPATLKKLKKVQQRNTFELVA